MGNYRGSDTDLGAAPTANSVCGRSHRLSKPRTFSSSSLSPNASTSRLDLAMSSSAKASPSGSHSSTNLLTVPSPSDATDHDENRRESRQKLRDHLFGPETEVVDDDNDEDSNDDEPRGGGIRGNARSIRHRFSKRASLRLSLAHTKSLSTTSLAREPSVEVVEEEETTVHDRIKEKAHHDQLLAYHQEGSERLMTSPFRRRSLFTPGLATRDASDILRKPPPPPPPPVDTPQPEHERQYYYDPQRSEHSPLARLAALDLAGRASPALDRCGTPGSVDYGHLSGPGAALRVTNGVASPAPSNLSRHQTLPDPRSLHELRREEDLFAASEGQRGTPSSIAVLKEIHRRSGEYVDAIDPPARAERRSAEICRTGWETKAQREPIKRKPSALRYERKPAPSPPSQRQASVRGLPDKDKPLPMVVPNELERAASQRAREYQSELPDSPFKEQHDALRERQGSPFPHLSLLATSKPSAMEDDLFEAQSIRSSVDLTLQVPSATYVDEAVITPASFVDEGLGMMSDGPYPVTAKPEDWSRPLPTPVARLGYQYEQQQEQHEAVPSSRPPPSPVAKRQSTFDSQHSEHSQHSQQTIKSDSGYSSGSSLHSLQKAASREDLGRWGPVDSPASEYPPARTEPWATTATAAAPTDMSTSSTYKPAALIRKPVASIDKSATLTKLSPTSSNRPATSTVVPASSNIILATPSDISAASTDKPAASTSVSRKLQKARPFPMPPPASRITVQCNPRDQHADPGRAGGRGRPQRCAHARVPPAAAHPAERQPRHGRRGRDRPRVGADPLPLALQARRRGQGPQARVPQPPWPSSSTSRTGRTTSARRSSAAARPRAAAVGRSAVATPPRCRRRPRTSRTRSTIAPSGTRTHTSTSPRAHTNTSTSTSTSTPRRPPCGWPTSATSPARSAPPPTTPRVPVRARAPTRRPARPCTRTS